MNADPPTEREERDDAAEALSADRLAMLQATVDHHARHIARVSSDAGGDIEDLRQALFLKAWAALPKFEPARGPWPAFIGFQVKSAAWDLAERRFRQHRLAARSLNSDRLIDSGRLPSWQPDPADVDDGQDDRFDAIDEALDIERVMHTLPDGLRQLCQLLRHESPTAAQRKSGLSAAEFYRRRDEIAMRFRAFGVSQR
jgi:DNA-directed RNA polymerase specialized sigma24 family protein